MASKILLSVVLMILSGAGVRSLICNEGINTTILGVPLYYWAENNCSLQSKGSCFTQELEVRNHEKVTFRYGGCISEAYSSFFTCKQLFSSDSNMNPSILLNIITDADDFLNNMAEEFRKNEIQKADELFSKGNGSEEFIEGVFQFFEIMDFNMKEARKLKMPLTKVFRASIGVDKKVRLMGAHYLANVTYQLMDAIGKLDTKEPKITDSIYKFLRTNVITRPQFPTTTIQDHADVPKEVKPLIENLPGLYKSMMRDPAHRHWIDVLFEILGKINIHNNKKTFEDGIAVLKANLDVSDDMEKFLDALTSIGDEIDKGNFTTIPLTLATKIVKAYGVRDTVTDKLSDTIIKFMGAVGVNVPGLDEFIIWLPGFFCHFFPEDEAHDKIVDVYQNINTGLESFNMDNIGSSEHLEHTNMSNFLLSFVRSFKPDMNPTDEALIINLSKMLYNAITPEYQPKLDIFVNVISDNFATFPMVNSGKLLSDMVTKLGGEIPSDVKPLLDNIQKAIDGLTQSNYFTFRDAFEKMVADYKKAFPDSEFPSIGERYYNIINQLVELQMNQNAECVQYIQSSYGYYNQEMTDKYTECVQNQTAKLQRENFKLMKMEVDVDVDLFYAIFRSEGFDSDAFVEKLGKDSALGTYVQLFRLLDPDDVKELMKDYSTWLANVFEDTDNYKFDNFVFAINSTASKITSKLGDFIKDLRFVHTPESCRHFSCSEDLCNTHTALTNIEPLTQDNLHHGFAPIAKKPINPSLPNTGGRAEVGILQILAMLLVAIKLKF